MAFDLRDNSSILLPYKPRKLAIGEGETMRINQDWLRCVTFLCVDRKKRVPIATAFWIRFTNEEDESIYWK